MGAPQFGLDRLLVRRNVRAAKDKNTHTALPPPRPKVSEKKSYRVIIGETHRGQQILEYHGRKGYLNAAGTFIIVS